MKHFNALIVLSTLAVISTTVNAGQLHKTSLNSAINRFRREDVDLHNGEFCVDVSTYGEVIFEPVQREKCDTTFQKTCETITEQVCDEVTEIQCDIVPYTECQMSMAPATFKTFEMVPKIYKKKECSEGMDTVQHTKMMPECRNVTKQNCITKWETDEEGNQVWAGNEACEPVTWRECKLVPRQVDFKVPKIDCTEGEEIPYTDCEETEKSQMVSEMLCTVLHTTDCQPMVSTKCRAIEYQECSEQPVEDCTEQEVMVPTQEKEHKKKCLLPADGSISSPRTSDNGTSSSADEETEDDSEEPRQERRLNEIRSGEQAQLRPRNAPVQLPLDRLAQVASIRQTRTIPGRVGPARLVSAKRVYTQQQQPVRRHQPNQHQHQIVIQQQ